MATHKHNERPGLQATLQKWEQRGSRLQSQRDKRLAKQPRPMFLPGFDIGAMPNHLNRSSLFAPIARGRRKFHHQVEMVTRRDCRLEYTGEQLDEADADLMMSMIYFAIPNPIGENVPINRAELLRKMGRPTNKQSYEWLHRRIRAMVEATLYLEVYKKDGSSKYKVGSSYGFHILSAFHYDAEVEKYMFQLDPRWFQLFSNREYALINWEVRLQIGRKQDMAKTLQRLISTSADNPQRYSLEKLKKQMQYGGRMRDFREAIKRAANELKRIEVIRQAKISKSTKGKPQIVLYLPTKNVDKSSI